MHGDATNYTRSKKCEMKGYNKQRFQAYTRVHRRTNTMRGMLISAQLPA
jgi:hypothetical protein